MITMVTCFSSGKTLKMKNKFENFMTQKEILLEQIASCRNQKNWFVPVSDAVAGLNAKQASKHDESTNHSVWQVVNHLIFWNERWLNRFKGITPPKLEGDTGATFSEDEGDQMWKLSVNKLDKVLSEWEKELKIAEETKLQNEALKDFGDSWYAVLSQITIHNAYHIGQIVTLRKQHGTWNPEAGVK